MTALGLVETRGLLAAIEGADAMLKTADVRLLEKSLVGGGLVTITIAGEVSAVRASVDAAVSAIGRIPGSLLVSEHVIARPDESLEQILALHPATECCSEAPASASDSFFRTTPAHAENPVFPDPQQVSAEGMNEPGNQEEAEKPAHSSDVSGSGPAKHPSATPVSPSSSVSVTTPASGPAVEPVVTTADTSAAAATAAECPTPAQLKKMSVNKLRQIARSLTTVSLSQEAVRAADKKTLIDAIINAYRQIEE